jgi:hypothetical protein
MNDGVKAHNLNIHMYSFSELLALFDLTIEHGPLLLDDLKRAKKKVLQLHPDKSRLPPDYFLFYKKAFDIIVKFYDEQNRQNQSFSKEATDYKPLALNEEMNKSTIKKVKSSIEEMTKNDEFHKRFNELFDQNMVKKPDPAKNKWFSSEDPQVVVGEPVTQKNMGQVFERIKAEQSTNALAKYQGIQTIVQTTGTTAIYDGDDEENNDSYVSSDPFSKLKFDDLRKVHKDQTVFAVGERDFEKVAKYKTVDEFRQAQNNGSLEPLEKGVAEQILKMKDLAYKEQMMKREYAAKLKTMEYEEKNRSVLSNFLRIK